jgi:cytochrome bd ubiquinol oxidase subunit I
MGASLGFHIVFASLGVGLPVLIAAAHFAGLRRNDAVWMRVAERLTRAFTVLVVIGVVSGIVISVELTLLWPRFMAAAGPAIGLPFSLETYAFFFEAIFLSLYLFGRERLSPWLHWATLIPVCIGASAWIVDAANAWMNTPFGFDYVGGQIRNP